MVWVIGNYHGVGADLRVCPGEHKGSPLQVAVYDVNSQSTCLRVSLRRDCIQGESIVSFPSLRAACS